jgi:hypothetical protein
MPGSNPPGVRHQSLEVSVKLSRLVVLVSVLLLIAACGGGASGDSATVPADTTTGGADVTTPPESTTVPEGDGSDAGTITDMSDMPEECIDAFRAFLQELEPIVEEIDFENATMADLETFGTDIEPIASQFEDETANCPELDLSTEDSIAFMREIAEQDAPGTVAYFEWLEEFIVSMDDGGVSASGDCETDIAALQVYVDQGGAMSELTLGDVAAVTSLMTAVSTECSPERFQEWISQEDVAAWAGG